MKRITAPAWAISFALLLGPIMIATPAQAQEVCSSRTLTVNGKPVTISLCPQNTVKSGTAGLLVTTRERVISGSTSVINERSFTFLAGESTSRAIEVVDLTSVGMTGRLHLTLAYRGGIITIESAVLTPGAIPID